MKPLHGGRRESGERRRVLGPCVPLAAFSALAVISAPRITARLMELSAKARENGERYAATTAP